jgi:hypothetical protein
MGKKTHFVGARSQLRHVFLYFGLAIPDQSTAWNTKEARIGQPDQFAGLFIEMASIPW